MTARGFYLAVDTATEACSVATWLDGAVRERFEPMQREHTQRLLPMIHAALADVGRSPAQLDGIVCGIGPGSFAGLRIGLGVVKGLALARDLPVAGVSSLAMLAQRAMRLRGARQVASAIDARMREVYFGAYRAGETGIAEPLIEDRVCAALDAPRLAAGAWYAAGTGWGPYGDALRTATAAQLAEVDAGALPHAEDALALGLPLLAGGKGATADALAPVYLRDRVALTLEEQAALRR